MRNLFSESNIKRAGHISLISLVGILLILGCGKKNNSPQISTPVVADVNPAASPIYIRPTTTTVVPPTGALPDLEKMTHSLRGWVARTHRVPKDFEDFTAQANIQFAPPPAGKKYAIGKRMTVILISQ